MYSVLFSVFVVALGALATWRTDTVYGRPAGLSLALTLGGIAAFAPLGSFLALLVAAGALTVARQEERRRLT